MAALVAWQALRILRRGGSFYDREVYGMTPLMHRRVCIASVVVLCVCLCATLIPTFPITPFVACETVATILYLASFVRGSSSEEE